MHDRLPISGEEDPGDGDEDGPCSIIILPDATKAKLLLAFGLDFSEKTSVLSIHVIQRFMRVNINHGT